jgi:peroxiredoxin
LRWRRAFPCSIAWAAAVLLGCSAPVSYRGGDVPAVLAPHHPPDADADDPVPLDVADADVLEGDLRLIRADRAVPSPPFEFVDDSGTHHTPQSLAGRVVRLTFWATWCATCKAEFPDLQRMHDEFAARGLVVLAVCRNSKPEEFARSVRKDWITFAAADAGDAGGFPFPLGAFPSTVVLDRSGRVRSFWQGWREPAAVERLVRRLLEERVPENAES